jgi:DHA1 family bicyclomycin/chloramphenicol resistance-like MFS transporter
VLSLAGAAAGSLAGVLLGLFIFMATIGMVMPNGTALALDRHPRRAGTAAALMGGAQAVIATTAGPLVGLGGEGSAVPMAAVIAACGALSLLAVLTLARPPREDASAPAPAPADAPSAAPTAPPG